MIVPGPFLPRMQEAYRVDAGVVLRAGAGRVPVQAILWTPANVIRIP